MAVARLDVQDLEVNNDYRSLTPCANSVSMETKRKRDSQSDIEDLSPEAEGMEVDIEDGTGGETQPSPETRDLHLTTKTAVGIVKAPPKKKVKTEKTGSGNSVTPLKKSRKISPKGTNVDASASLETPISKAKSTKGDLPPLLQDDPDDKWSNIILPTLLLWFGDQQCIWSIPDDELTRVLVAIVKHVYRSKSVSELQHEIRHGSAIYNLANQRLTRWRNMMGTVAIRIAQTYLSCNSTEDMTSAELVALLLDEQAFAYENFDYNDKPTAFLSPLLLELLGTTHLQDIQGCVDIPGLDIAVAEVGHRVKGALALCTAALQRAFQLAATGEDNSQEVGTSNRLNQKQPRTLNKVTGKMSTKGSAFSQQNWGGGTQAYYEAICNRSVETLKKIFASALCFTNSLPLASTSLQALGPTDQIMQDLGV
ncbi:hypothetical protein J3R83DRAFT_11471 [Lanmaoa asiatica]|nr:hypothetical protein J3R83DRAFT_11471 [Lanmaoa asiatica]